MKLYWSLNSFEFPDHFDQATRRQIFLESYTRALKTAWPYLGLLVAGLILNFIPNIFEAGPPWAQTAISGALAGFAYFQFHCISTAKLIRNHF
jgi:hypothetical protein